MRRIEVLQSMNADVGLVSDIEVVPTGFDCPVHEVPVEQHQLYTRSGWQAITVCPSFDGSCRHDPNSVPTFIDSPSGEKPNTGGPSGGMNTAF